MKHFTKKLALLTLLVGLSASAWAQTTYFSQDYEAEGATADWVTGNADRYTVALNTVDGNTYLAVSAVGNGNNGTTITNSATNGTVAANTDFYMSFDLILRGGNNQTSSFYIYDASNSTAILSLEQIATNNYFQWKINGNDGQTISGTDVWCTFEIARKGTTEYLTITKKSDNTVLFSQAIISKLSDNGGLGKMVFNTKRYYSSMSIDNVLVRSLQEGDYPPAAPVSYSINYIFDGTVISTESGESLEGETIEATSPITVEGQKYFAVDGATTSMELVDGENVLEVEVRKANEYAYSVKNSFGTTLAEGTYVEGNAAVFVGWSKYVENNGKWYECDESTYSVSITGDVDKTVSYSTEADIDYFFEAEDMILSRSYGDVSNNANFSGGKGRGVYSGANLATTSTIPAGVYNLGVYAIVRRANADQFLVQISTDGTSYSDLGTLDIANSVTGLFTTEITLNEDSYIRFVENTNNNMYHHIDYVTLKKLDVTVPGSIAAGKYATRIFPFAPTVLQGITFYSCNGMLEGKATTLALTEVSAPEANVPYILENTTNADIDITQTGIDIHENDTYTAGLLTGAFANTVITSGYVLQTQNGKQSFFKVANDNPITVPPYRAYLNYSAGVKSIGFDTTTAINTLEVLTSGAYEGIYTVDGVKLNNLEKGVNILKMADGTTRKVIVK